MESIIDVCAILDVGDTGLTPIIRPHLGVVQLTLLEVPTIHHSYANKTRVSTQNYDGETHIYLK